jgi:hypothetical protein
MAACALAVLMAVLCVTPAAADLDTGMEGLWTGSNADGEMTLLLGSGGTFISIYQADDTYQQAGVFTTDQDNMYLTMTDGSTSTLQYGFAEGSLYLSSEGDEIELKRADFPAKENFTGVWIVNGEGGTGSGLISMDASGGFASVDARSGEAEKGIYLPAQGEMLIAFQDCTALKMGYTMDETGGALTLTNEDSGVVMQLTRYAPAATE